MKLTENVCGDLRAFRLPPNPMKAELRDEDDPGIPYFKVDFEIAFTQEHAGLELSHEIKVSISIVPHGAYSDRFTLEDEAAEQLPNLLRDAADELENAFARRVPRVRDL